MTPETEVVPPDARAAGFSISPPASPPPAAWRGLGVWGAVGLCALFALVAGCAWFELALLQVLLHVRLHLSTQLFLVHTTATLSTLWVGLPRSGLSLAAAFPLRRFRPALLPAILLTALGLLLAIPWVMRWLPLPSRSLLEFFASLGRDGWIAVVLVIGIVAPFSEELLFRGLLLGALRRRYSTATAVLVSTALFVLIHGNYTQGTAALVMGLVNCWLVLRTGSLVPAMLFHATWNSATRLVGATSSPQAAHPGLPGPLWLSGGALAAALGLSALWWLLRAAPGAAEPDGAASAPRPASARLAAALALPLLIVFATARLAPPGAAMTLMGVQQGRHARRPPPDPVPFAGCYELTSPAMPLTLLGDPGVPALRLRLTLDTLPQAGGVTHYLAQPLGTSSSTAPGERPYWFIDSGGMLRLVRTWPDGGTIVRVRLKGASMAGTVARYGRAGEPAGAPGQVSGRRLACPGAASRPGR